jgi:membrane protease subunit HflK
MIMQAQGKTAQFAQILPEYKRAPQVTRDRMYLDTLQEVYMKTPKILVDVAGGNNVIYLPVDQLQRKKTSDASERAAQAEAGTLYSENQSNMSTPSSSASDRPDYDDPDRSGSGRE